MQPFGIYLARIAGQHDWQVFDCPAHRPEHKRSTEFWTEVYERFVQKKE